MKKPKHPMKKPKHPVGVTIMIAAPVANETLCRNKQTGAPIAAEMRKARNGGATKQTRGFPKRVDY